MSTFPPPASASDTRAGPPTVASPRRTPIPTWTVTAVWQSSTTVSSRTFVRFEKTFSPHVDLRLIPEQERQAYIHDWSQPGAMKAMLNWYRAAAIEVPAMGEKAHKPLWAQNPFFPEIKVPVLVVWGLKDKALLPIQLDGLQNHVPDLRWILEPDAGHFIPWEKPEVVTSAIRDFIAETV